MEGNLMDKFRWWLWNGKSVQDTIPTEIENAAASLEKRVEVLKALVNRIQRTQEGKDVGGIHMASR